ncbi:hypothetical protein [Streptomyces decoyicus]|uniref:hypothetical protein n=1 Tax=Streptomyces decoyicus TaxID=249567 RepID=UPI003865BCE1|nr:hypothetical protein OG532_18880 [Streptomyces decoyicus]
MTHRTGIYAMNENELDASAAGRQAESLTLLREMTAMAVRLSEEIRAVREDLAEQRKDQAPA